MPTISQSELLDNLCLRISLSMNLTITAIYWFALFPVRPNTSGILHAYSVESLVLSINVHSAPIIGLLFDLFFNSFNFYWRRLILIFAYGLIYIGMNAGMLRLIQPTA